MKQPSFTPLPWRVDRTWGSEMIVAADGGVMFNDDSNDTIEGVAEYIVHCVNTHDELQAKIEHLTDLLSRAQPTVCSMLCPNVRTIGREWEHSSLCALLCAALAQRGEG